jgi:hypothetical protein
MIVELAGLIVSQGYIPLFAHPERSDVVWHLLATPLPTGRGGAVGQDVDLQAMPGGFMLGKLIGRRRPPITQRDVPGSREFPEETLFQANLGSFVGYYGALPQLRAYQLLRRGIYNCLATDLHEARSADDLLDSAHEKMLANPVLKTLANTDHFCLPA